MYVDEHYGFGGGTPPRQLPWRLQLARQLGRATGKLIGRLIGLVLEALKPRPRRNFRDIYRDVDRPRRPRRHHWFWLALTAAPIGAFGWPALLLVMVAIMVL